MLFILLSILILSPNIAQAVITTLDSETTSISLNGRIDVLRDPTGKLTFEDIIDQKIAQQFKPHSGRFSAGFTTDIVWLRFTLQRANNDVGNDWFLEIYPPFLDYLTLYRPDTLKGHDSSYIEIKSGRLLPISSRPIRDINFIFPINIHDTKPHTYYMRVDTTGSLFVDAKLWKPKLFYKHSSNAFLIQGGFLGISVLLALLNLIFYLILRDRLFIYYSMTLISLSAVLSIVNGLASLYIFPETPRVVYIFVGLSLSALYIAGSLLLEAVISFDNHPLLKRAYLLVRVFSIFAILITLLGGYRYVGAPLQIIGLFLSISAIYVSVMAIYRKMPFAKLYGITFIIYYLGGVMLTIRNINPFGLAHPFMDNIFQIGVLIHMILIQIVIAHRFQRLEIERRDAQKKVELEAIRTQKLESLSLLAGGIAHDFNNMLTTIISTITLAKMYAENNQKVISKISEAETEIMHARGLTNQLLTFAKGGAPVKTLSSIADLVLETVRFSLKGSNIESEFFIADDLWSLEVDRAQISQVISNITINAKQSMPEGGKITVTMENTEDIIATNLPLQRGRYLKISIKDTGKGIKPEDIERVFDPFYTTKEQGSGIGLAVSQSIIGKHRGHIEVKSQLSKGTTFIIYLPASEDSYVKETSAESIELKGAGRVLIMDDDKTLLINVADMLRALGYEVETALKGEDTLSLYRAAHISSKPFDIVIMDVTIIGGMGARQCIEEIKKISPEVKAIVMSGYSEEVILSQHKKYGFKEFISKPFTIEQLHRTIQQVMKS